MLFISSTVSLTFGLFMLWLVFSLEVLGDLSTLQALTVIPSSVQTNNIEFMLFCRMLTLAALGNISYAVSGETVLSWLVVVFSQVTGTFFLWQVALMPHFNVHNLSLVGLIGEVVTGGHDLPSTAYLLMLPAMVVFFLCCKPGSKGKVVHWQDKIE